MEFERMACGKVERSSLKVASLHRKFPLDVTSFG